MRRLALASGAVLFTLVLASCGGGGGSPVAPTNPAPAPTVTDLRFRVAGTPEVGRTIQLISEAVLSDGAVRNVTAETTWESLSINVAVISAPGQLSGVAAGLVTIRATYQGRSVQTTLRVRGRSREVIVRLRHLQCLEDCDATLNGDGDFAYRLIVSATEGDDLKRVSHTAQTSGYPSGTTITLGNGDTYAVTRTYTFRVREEAGAYIEVEFRATEQDSVPDSRLNDRSATARFVWNATRGWGNTNRSDHYTTLGSSGCRIRLHYEIQIR